MTVVYWAAQSAKVIVLYKKDVLYKKACGLYKQDIQNGTEKDEL